MDDRGRGVSRVYGSKEHGRHASRPFPFPDEATDCRFEQTGGLWIVGAKTGVTRISKQHETLNLGAEALPSASEHFRARDGLTSDRALATLEDREGKMWVATAEGLDRFRVTTLEPTPLPATFGHYMVAGQPDGSNVIGTESDGLQKVWSGKDREGAGRHSEAHHLDHA